ncbi:MAG: beta-ketoacyl synthase N-terminal-like domain-containing protein, partial [Myxococcota bacterium]|nr:beta-ketoacyl synthase N-terminal-like domain-containing protein [Myxococcota bacterium]
GMGLDLETTSWNLGWVAEELAQSWLQLHAEEADKGSAEDWTREVRAVLGHGLDATRTVGALGGIIASRIARELRFGGPSFALSAEDGSGLRGLEVASRLLQRGEVDLMLVGAVDLAGDVRAVLAQDRIEPWSRSGVARPMDHRADGPVVGEGAGAVLLKRLSDAERDGDRIYAVVDGCGAGADWSTALTRAQEDAGSDQVDLGLVELAASGSPERDATELRALADFLKDDASPTALSAIRGLIGDAGAAGGLASLMKTALALYHRRLPALPNFERPAEGLVPEGSAFHVPIAPQYWHQDQSSGPRRAGVSDRSLFGNHLHVRLSEWLAGNVSPGSPDLDARDLPVGPRAYGLFAYDPDEVPALRQLVTESAHEGVEELAARWFRRRGGKGSSALVAQSIEELLRRSDLPQPERPGLDGAVAWVFPGSGSHYVGMGRSLGEAFPAVQRQIDASTTRLASQLAVSETAPWRLDWTGDWEADAQARLESSTRRVIFGQVAHGAAVGKTLAWFGLKPDAVIGYSLGESAGLFASGAWSARDTMFERMLASELFDHQLVGACTVAAEAYGTARPDWVAAVVRAPVEEVRTELKGSVRLLIVNAPGECVVGGRRRDVELLAGRLDCGDPILLEGVPTVHSELVDPVAEDYRKLHVLPTEALEGVRFYSGNWTRAYDLDSDESAAASIVANATRGLDYQRTIEQAWADGVRIFIEGGPGTSCTRMIGAILGDRPHLALSVCQAGVDGGLAMLRGLAKLIRAGVEVDLNPLYGEDSGVWMRPEQDRRPLVSVVAGGGRPKPPSIATLPSSSTKNRQSGGRTFSSMSAGATPSGSQTQEDRGMQLRPEMVTAPATASEEVAQGGNAVHAAPSDGRAETVGLGGALITEQMRIGEATARAHGLFLDTSEGYRKLALDLHARMTEWAALAGSLAPLAVPAVPVSRPQPEPAGASRQRPTLSQRIAAASPVTLPAEPFALDRDKCMDIAIGSIGEVLGPMFAPADDYPTRVRLPDEPLMLVDRILSIEGQPGQMGSGRVVTEHDVLPGNWYLDGGRCPVCISVEAGQADLFLSGYLGIDLQTQGLRVYRLLDAEVCFHRDLPRVGETIRYDIRIDRFIRQGSTWLFFFHFEGFIGDEHLISMRNGCAGFFSAEQLE